MKEQKDFLQVSKAAHMLDCSTDYIHTLIGDGRLDAIRLGPKATRVSRQSLNKLIEEARVKPEDYYR